MRTLALLLCLAACDAGAKPEPAPTPAKLTAPVKQPTAVVSHDLTYLPVDSDVVIHVDVARLRRSKLWATYAADAAKWLAPGLGGCDYDPLSQVATVDIGIPITTKLDVFVFRGIDRDRALACFRALKMDSDQKATFDGDFVTLARKTGATYVLTFVDAHTMVMQGSTQPTKQTLQQALQVGADAPLRGNAPFVAAMNKPARSAAMTIASRPGSEAMAAQMTTTGVQLSYFYGALDLTDRLGVDYSMVVSNADHATQLANMMRGQLGSAQVKQMFDRIDAHSQGDTVTLDVEMSETKLASLAGMMRGMLTQP